MDKDCTIFKMEDKEKILRLNLQEAEKEYNSDIGEHYLASVIFSIKEQRLIKVQKCLFELEKYLWDQHQIIRKKTLFPKIK